jgi:hypothetical protein
MYEVPAVHAGRSDLIVILMIARMTPPPLAVQMIVDEVGGMIQGMMTQVMIVDVLAPRPQPRDQEKTMTQVMIENVLAPIPQPRDRERTLARLGERGPRVSAALITPIVPDVKMIKNHTLVIYLFFQLLCKDDVP